MATRIDRLNTTAVQGRIGWVVVDLRPEALRPKNGTAFYCDTLEQVEKLAGQFHPDYLVAPLDYPSPAYGKLLPDRDVQLRAARLANHGLQARIGKLSEKLAKQAETISSYRDRVTQANLRARRAIRESRVGKLEEENRQLRAENNRLRRLAGMQEILVDMAVVMVDDAAKEGR